MSVNLNLTVDNKPVDLWQTPTEVTYMCLITDNGEFNWELTGNKARAAIARYIAWARSRSDGVYKNRKDADDKRRLVKEHTDRIEATISKARQIKVYAS
jgi:hypothetical protein